MSAPLLTNFEASGFCQLGSVVPRELTDAILTGVLADRVLSSEVFLSQQGFEKAPEFRGVNPRPGRNVLEHIPELIEELEALPLITDFLRSLLGNAYQILDRKIVCGVPDHWLDQWLRDRIEGKPVNNLGAYVKPEYRDMTFFYGIDFHQDLIDWPGKEPDFITLYVYLEDVSAEHAPILLLPNSYSLGATKFPHDLSQVSADERVWRYSSEHGASIETAETEITGRAGSVTAWHACTLHGTAPVSGRKARLSLRYLIRSTSKNTNPCVLQRINKGIQAPLMLAATREDQNQMGEVVVERNYIWSSR